MDIHQSNIETFLNFRFWAINKPNVNPMEHMEIEQSSSEENCQNLKYINFYHWYICMRVQGSKKIIISIFLKTGDITL